MFVQFEKLLGEGERIEFSICRQGHRLTVLIQPGFTGTLDTQGDPALEQLRAALSMPLCVTDTAAHLDRDFPASLAQYAGGISAGRSAFSQAMSRIKEASKAAMGEGAQPVSTVKTPPLAAGDDQTTEGRLMPSDSKSLF